MDDSYDGLPVIHTGLLQFLESPCIFSGFSRPAKSLKEDMVLESP